MTTDGQEVTAPEQQPLFTETKVYIRSLNITRGSEAERLRGPGRLEARLLYGPISIEKVDHSDDSTQVHFLVRLTLDSDWLSITAAFGGHQIYPEAYSDDRIRTESFLRTIAGGVAPYVQEIIANLTGRLGINPIIIPIGGDQVTILEGRGE